MREKEDWRKSNPRRNIACKKPIIYQRKHRGKLMVPADPKARRRQQVREAVRRHRKRIRLLQQANRLSWAETSNAEEPQQGPNNEPSFTWYDVCEFLDEHVGTPAELPDETWDAFSRRTVPPVNTSDAPKTADAFVQTELDGSSDNASLADLMNYASDIMSYFEDAPDTAGIANTFMDVLDQQADENEDEFSYANGSPSLERFLNVFVNEYYQSKPDHYSYYDKNGLMDRWTAIADRSTKALGEDLLKEINGDDSNISILMGTLKMEATTHDRVANTAGSSQRRRRRPLSNIGLSTWKFVKETTFIERLIQFMETLAQLARNKTRYHNFDQTELSRDVSSGKLVKAGHIVVT